jgi:uncharacterized protein (TIGR00369 family)
MSAIAPHLAASFERQGMMKTFGAMLLSCADGRCEIEAPILALASQQHGYGHAALPFGLADSAMGYAALSTLSADREVVTAEIKVNLMSPSVGDALIARARVIKPGKRLIVVLGEVFARSDGAERQVALLTGTLVPVDP